MRSIKITAIPLLLALVMAASAAGCSLELPAGTGNSTIATTQSTDAPSANEPSATVTATTITTESSDYYVVLGTAVIEHSVVSGEIDYCPADNLGRAVCAYGSLTPELRSAAKARGRQDITIDPAGWPKNKETSIPATDLPGSKSYNGWFWNRSHLLADSLGGDAILENLVTGTRTQNVGSTQVNGQASGGMAYTERLAREYLDAQTNNACPLYYAATSNYTGSELIPRSVTVNMQSCDGSLDMRVEVSNTAQSWSIDYANGNIEKTS